MSGMFDILFQHIKDRFPQLSWKLGSVVRTLLIDPLTEIGTEVDAYTDSLKSSLDLHKLLDSPAGRDAELDVWMNRLRLSLPEPRQAAGSVALICDSADQSFTVAAGTTFRWPGGVSLRSTQRVDVSSETLTQLGPYVYRIVIPVAADSDARASIGAGTAVVWDEAPATVTDMYVYSAVTGGQTSASAQAKAAMIKSALEQPTVCGASSILASLVRKFGPTIVDVALTSRVENGGNVSVPLYIKQSTPPSKVDFDNVPATYNGDSYIVRIPAACICTLDKVLDASGNPTIPTKVAVSSDAEYIEIGVPAGGDYHVQCTAFESANAAAEWLNSVQCGSPFRMQARTPALADIGIQLNIGTSDLSANARAAICDFINGSVLGATISDEDLRKILSEYGYSLNGASVYTAQIRGVGLDTSVTRTGSLTLSAHTELGSIPTAAYCTYTNIEAF